MSMIDITERKLVQEEIRAHKKELEIKSFHLEEATTALKVLLQYREEDKINLEKKILVNMKELVFPYIEKLKRSRLVPIQMKKLEILEKNLKDITSPYLHNLTSRYSDLTPREIDIISLVKAGKTTKEISEIMNTSTRTTDFHRDNIRRKLGLKNKRVNLRSFLLSLQ
jgi:DNA-binding CsgD family transcriptional regulator